MPQKLIVPGIFRAMIALATIAIAMSVTGLPAVGQTGNTASPADGHTPFMSPRRT